MPAVVTLALALGAHRMARRSAVVRHLPAVETLGSVTLIASDKTGTLTEGQMRAEVVWTPNARLDAHGPGYEPVGELRVGDEPVTAVPDGLRPVVHDLVLCNHADVLPPDGGHADWHPAGDPQDAALVALARRGGIDVPGLRVACPRIAELPFDSGRRRMTTLHRLGDDRYLVVCKGAPEVLFAEPGLLRPIAGRGLERFRRAADALAGAGYRVLAVADQIVDRPPEQLERGLQLRGLVAIVDPLREGAAEAAEQFRQAGVRLALVTGDHPATARAIARQIGLADRTVAIGDRLTPAELSGLGATVDVYARISPEQKLDLVRAWQERGEVVAMTGDGVNDAPALRRADIGVAMGRGTEVARQAADLVLADDEPGTIAVAIEEGRRIYANVRRFLRFGLSGGFAEVIIMVIGPFFGTPIPLLPSQILWVNMLTHGLPGVAMGAEPADSETMSRRPVTPGESVLARGLWQQVLWLGVVIAAAALGGAVWVAARGGPWQTTVFLVLGLAQLGVALALRARPNVRDRARFFTVAVGVALVLQVAPVYVPWFADLLALRPLDLAELLIAAGVATVPGLALRLGLRLSHRLRAPEGDLGH